MGALCPDLEKSQVYTNPCLQMEDMNLLLPIVQITVVRDKLEKAFNCQLDSGSQSSNQSYRVLNILHCCTVLVKKTL